MGSPLYSRYLKTSFLTGLALSAFAANSVLCRMALGGGAIDPAGFTGVRLLAGAAVLLIIISRRGTGSFRPQGSPASSLALFVYAAAFSFAYLTLDTGTGALILFGSVQITMVLWSIVSGERRHRSELAGIAIAFSGFVYLILPDLSTPSAAGFLLMSVAGISWGIYTLRGRNSQDPLRDTSNNFIRSIPLAFILMIINLPTLHFTPTGLWLAGISGAVASGIGYTIWYAALHDLSATRAAVVQLSVPVIAATGGVVFVGETVTLRLTIASLLILGGILVVIAGRYLLSLETGSPDSNHKPNRRRKKLLR